MAWKGYYLITLWWFLNGLMELKVILREFEIFLSSTHCVRFTFIEEKLPDTVYKETECTADRKSVKV